MRDIVQFYRRALYGLCLVERFCCHWAVRSSSELIFSTRSFLELVTHDWSKVSTSLRAV